MTQRLCAPSKWRYNGDNVLHHTRMGLCCLQRADVASNWLCCSSHGKRSLSSLDIATSPQNLLTMLKRTRKERAGRGHTNCRFSLVALAIRDLWNSSPVSSTKSFKEKTCQSENSSSLQLRRAGSTTARSTRQREHRKTLPASLPLLCFQPRNFLGEMCEFLSTD